MTAAGTLALVPVADRPDLVAEPVAQALRSWPRAGEVSVAEIDPALADTAALVAAHGVPLEMSANCVVVAGRRGGDERIAACVVLATTRADVNGLVRRLLDVRKASFLAMDLPSSGPGWSTAGSRRSACPTAGRSRRRRGRRHAVRRDRLRGAAQQAGAAGGGPGRPARRPGHRRSGPARLTDASPAGRFSPTGRVRTDRHPLVATTAQVVAEWHRTRRQQPRPR